MNDEAESSRAPQRHDDTLPELADLEDAMARLEEEEQREKEKHAKQTRLEAKRKRIQMLGELLRDLDMVVYLELITLYHLEYNPPSPPRTHAPTANHGIQLLLLLARVQGLHPRDAAHPPPGHGSRYAPTRRTEAIPPATLVLVWSQFPPASHISCALGWRGHQGLPARWLDDRLHRPTGTYQQVETWRTRHMHPVPAARHGVSACQEAGAEEEAGKTVGWRNSKQRH